MRPVAQSPKLEDVTVFDAPRRPAGQAVRRHLPRRERLRGPLAGEPFGLPSHTMLIQIPIGAWVSGGWLD